MCVCCVCCAQGHVVQNTFEQWLFHYLFLTKAANVPFEKHIPAELLAFLKSLVCHKQEETALHFKLALSFHMTD